MLVEILWKPTPAAFCADTSYSLVSFSLLLHVACFMMIELPVSSDTIYLKSCWGKKKPATKRRRSYSYIQFMHQPLRPYARFFGDFYKYVLALFLFLPSLFKGDQAA